MKKCTLLAGLCVAALVALPTASASALTGACVIKGTAKFTGGTLKFTTPETIKYKFKGAPGLPGAALLEKLAQEIPSNPPRGEAEAAVREVAKLGEAAPGAVCAEGSLSPLKLGTAKVEPGEIEATCIAPVLPEQGTVNVLRNLTDGDGTLEVGPSPTFDLDIAGSALGVVNLKIEKKPRKTETEELTAAEAPEAVGAAEFFTSGNESGASCLGGAHELEFAAVVAGSVS
jgi:hypothetical protein